ncbi:hypothetical protein NDU88_006023 [Pleurodeles waltl]|uniref:Uncharacterized protein n=1 Tax=Pleurodeles waltl TaxID=8319 RepID=A0AAV7UJU7_PLEWA|nr:hypothetical protein NDU88_006023 [Pleurodeles waltl]
MAWRYDGCSLSVRLPLLPPHPRVYDNPTYPKIIANAGEGAVTPPAASKWKSGPRNRRIESRHERRDSENLRGERNKRRWRPPSSPQLRCETRTRRGKDPCCPRH